MEEVLNMKNVIYKITFPNGKMYIGLTTQKFRNRMNGHKRDALRKVNKPLYSAMNKCGFDNLKWEIIDTAKNKEELVEKEIFWIKRWNTYINSENSMGYNLTLGGEGTFGLIGELHHSSIFNEKQAKEIKIRLHNGESIVKIAKEYKVNQSAISSIKTCKSWSHVLPELEEDLLNSLKVKPEYDLEVIRNIKLDLSKNLKIQYLINKYKVSKRLVQDIRDIKRYKDVEPQLNAIINNLEWNNKIYSDELIYKIKKEMVETNQFNSMYYVRKYNASRGLVSSIKLGERHSNIASEYNELIKTMYKGTKFLSKEDVIDIKTRLYQGERINDLANEYDIHRDKVRSIFYLKAHKNVLSEFNEKLIELGILEKSKYPNIKR